MASKTLYRITFSYLDAIYEMYARKVYESDLFGFVEVEEFVFGEHTSLVVDPSEERLKTEFHEVTRTYVPAHAVLRIDVVHKRGTAKIHDKQPVNGKISPFPVRPKN